MSLSSHINLLRDKICWSVVAGEGTGSVVSLGFGRKLLRKKALKNPSLTDDERRFGPEIELLVYCAWRLTKSNGVICGWRDSNDTHGDLLASLETLRNKTVLDVHHVDITHDLELSFEGGTHLQIFCDQTNDYESDDNYVLYTSNSICSVGLKSVLDIEHKNNPLELVYPIKK